MSEIRIRAAHSGDLHRLNKLMFDLHDLHHNACPDSIKTATEIEKEKSVARYLDDPECLVYVATAENRIIGLITGHFCELVSVISKPVLMGSVDEIYVEPAYRNRKVAQQLMSRIETTFIQYGVRRIFVEVWDFNKSAIRFYHNYGFDDHIHYLCKTLK